jgi:hypothetical protein
VPEAEPADHTTLVELTFPPVVFHFVVAFTNPTALLVQLALKGALAARSFPEVTVTAGLPVVPVEQVSVALIDIVVEAGAPTLSGGLNFSFPTTEHWSVPLASNRGDLAATAEA